MRKIILLLCFISVYQLSAQTVFEISWEPGISFKAASPTIEIGDTVKWIWTDESEKSVTTLPRARAIFDSGLLYGRKNSFSHTFTSLGVTRYENEANPQMRGEITVVDRLSMEDKFAKNLSFYPNPVERELTINSPFDIDNYQIFNVLGSKVLEGKGQGKTTRIPMGNLNSGLYFVKVSSNNLQSTLKITKN